MITVKVKIINLTQQNKFRILGSLEYLAVDGLAEDQVYPKTINIIARVLLVIFRVKRSRTSVAFCNLTAVDNNENNDGHLFGNEYEDDKRSSEGEASCCLEQRSEVWTHHQ